MRFVALFVLTLVACTSRPSRPPAEDVARVDTGSVPPSEPDAPAPEPPAPEPPPPEPPAPGPAE